MDGSEEEKSRRGQTTGELGRYGVQKAAERLGGKEAGKEVGKQAAKEGIKKASMAAGPEAAAAVEAADLARQAVTDPREALKKVGMAIGAVVAAVTAAVISVIAVFLLVIAIPIAIIAVMFGMVEIGGAGEAFTVTKVASPDRLNNGTSDAPFADVTYTVTLTNKLDVDITDITLVDDKCTIPAPSNRVAVLAKNGGTTTVSYTCSVPTVPGDTIHTNTVIATGTAQLTDFEGNPAPELVRDRDSAAVRIGNPKLTDPTGWPLGDGVNTWITQTPYCQYDPDTCPSHSQISAVDIRAPAGTYVYATHDGIASWGDQTNTAYKGGLGIFVRIQGANYTTLYGHLSSINTDCPFKDGTSAQIRAGSLIGYVDNTGWSEGNHLHYHVLDNILGQVDKEKLSEVFPPGYDVVGTLVTTNYGGESCE